MVTKHTGSSYLLLFCSLFGFPLLDISPYSREKLTLILVSESLWDISRPQASNKQQNTRFTAFLSEEKHRRLWQHIVSRQCDFFLPPLQNSIIGGKKTQWVSPKKIITPWQKRLSCSVAERDRAWDTNVTFFSASYSKAMYLYVNSFAMAFVTPVMMQNLIQTSRNFKKVPDCLAGLELLMASTQPLLLKGSSWFRTVHNLNMFPTQMGFAIYALGDSRLVLSAAF